MMTKSVKNSTEIARYNVLGMTQSRLTDFLLSIGEKPFRAKQIMKWIHHCGVDDFALMTDLSKALREKLMAMAEKCLMHF